MNLIPKNQFTDRQKLGNPIGINFFNNLKGFRGRVFSILQISLALLLTICCNNLYSNCNYVPESNESWPDCVVMDKVPTPLPARTLIIAKDNTLQISNLALSTNFHLTNNKIPSVTTDKLDYKPGETAVITATGFKLGETIEFLILHIDGKSNTGGGHIPWKVTDGGSGDLDGKVDGNIKTTWYVDPDDSLNSLFELTAEGQSSGMIATHIFKDDVAVPTSVTPIYDPNTDILTLDIEWAWTDNNLKVVSVGVFADLNGDGLIPDALSDPSTWVASSTSGNGMGTDLATPSDEFLGQIASSSIEGSTVTDATCMTIGGDNTDNGISSLALAAINPDHDPNTPIVLFPYGLEVVDNVCTTCGPSTAGCFRVTYSNVTVQPASICVVLYDIHTDGGTTLPNPATNNLGSINDGSGNHSVITATVSGGPAHNGDNSQEDGFGGTTIGCDDPINTIPICIPTSVNITVIKN